MANNGANPICGISAALDEAKAGIDLLKEKVGEGLASIGDLGALADTIKAKLAEVNVPQVPSVNLQQELANLPNLSPEEYAAKVEELKKRFGEAMTKEGFDLNEIIDKIPKPAGLTGDAKNIFADLSAASDKVGAAFRNAQEQLSKLNIESIVGDICKDVPNLEVEIKTQDIIIVNPKDPQRTTNVTVEVPATPVKAADPPKTPAKDPVKESRPADPPSKGFTFAFTPASLEAACGKNAVAWYNYLNQMLPKYNITTPERVAAFCANVTVETGWKNIEEDGRYSAKLLYEKLNPKKSRFPTLADAEALVQKGREAIMNYIYANRMLNGSPESGDGFKYRGRGLKQLTGKDNYIRASKAFFGDDRLVTNPDQVVTDKNIAVETGCWYYKTTNIAAYADKKDWGACASLVNAGRPDMEPAKVLGYNDRLKLTEKAYAAFKG